MAARLVYGNREVPLTSAASECIIGRHRSCDLQVEDQSCSRQHCKLRRLPDGGFELVDLGSANGTKLNGSRFTQPQPLADGDLIALGQTQLVFRDHEAFEDDPAQQGEHALSSASYPAAVGRVATPAPESLGPDRQAKQFAPEDLIGQRLAGYRLKSIVLPTNTGTVYAAKQLSLDRTVAIRVFSRAAVCCRPGFIDDVLTAARKAGRLHQDGIVQMHECGFDDGLLWYSMEYVAGEVVGRRLREDGRIELPVALLIADRLASALREAHLIDMPHCDIRPDNILISSTGVVKLIDFGVAPLLQEARQIIERGSTRGNPLYTPAEYHDDPTPHPLVDIYSLGCTIFHLLTGKPPFTGHRSLDIVEAHRNDPIPEISKRRPGLPEALDDLMQGMLAKNPDWRFQSIDEWQTTVQRMRDDLQQSPAATPAPRVAAPRPASPTRNPSAHTPVGPSRRRTESATVEGTRRRSGSWVNIVIFLILIGGLIAAFPLLQQLAGDQPFLGQAGGPDGESASELETTTHNTDPVTPALPIPEQYLDQKPATDDAAATVNGESTGSNDPWQRQQAQLVELTAAAEWSRAEYALQRFAAEHAGDARLATVVDSQLRQLRNDAGAWYAAAIDELPADDQLDARLARLLDLRGRAASRQRADLESRYRQTLDRLRRELSIARRDLVQLMEAGELDRLIPRSKELTGKLDQTGFADLEDQLQAQAAAASDLAWQGDWPTTRQHLLQADGAAAIPAAAALMLLGDRGRAASMLLRGNQFDNPELQQRRDRLLATQAVILDFDDPGDLSHFQVLAGEPSSQDGALTGPAGDPLRLDCNVAIGGSGWECAIDLRLQELIDAEVASAQLSIRRQDAESLTLRLLPDASVLTVTGVDGERRGDSAFGEGCTLRLRAAGGRLQVVLGSETLLDGVATSIPPDSHLRLETIGVDWRLDTLHIVGGG